MKIKPIGTGTRELAEPYYERLLVFLEEKGISSTVADEYLISKHQTPIEFITEEIAEKLMKEIEGDTFDRWALTHDGILVGLQPKWRKNATGDL